MRMKTWTVNSLADVGSFFGVPVSTCEYWRKQGLPGEPGSWDVGKITRWRLAKLDNGADLSADLKRADIRLKTAQSEQRELEMAVQRGEFLVKTDVELWAATALIEAREQIMSLPEVLCTSMPPDQREFVRAEADLHCRNTLTALRRRLESDSIAPESAHDDAKSSFVSGHDE